MRLAGDAVRLAQPDGVVDNPQGQDLRRKAGAARDAGFLVSL